MTTAKCDYIIQIVYSIDPGKIKKIYYYINNQYLTSHNKEICKEYNI